MDVQLSNDQRPNEFIFVRSVQTARTLSFKFKRLRWNPKYHSLRPVSTKKVKPADFSSVWTEMHNQGWKVCG